MNPTATFQRIREDGAAGAIPGWTHPQWTERFPWLVQGTTGAGEGSEPFTLGLWGQAPVGEVLGRWRNLRRELRMPTAVHALQVHGAKLRLHTAPAAGELILTEEVDGHLTRQPGALLTVSIADCVPIFLVDPERRAVALLHGGWRGIAAGILEAALGALEDEFGSEPRDLWMHCGPSICGECYEVGPEVHAAVRPWVEAPAAPMPVDLRAAVAERAVARGLVPERITLSTHCTRCGPGAFFSHRGGSSGRQVGFLGVRSGSGLRDHG